MVRSSAPTSPAKSRTRMATWSRQGAPRRSGGGWTKKRDGERRGRLDGSRGDSEAQRAGQPDQCAGDWRWPRHGHVHGERSDSRHATQECGGRRRHLRAAHRARPRRAHRGVHRRTGEVGESAFQSAGSILSITASASSVSRYNSPSRPCFTSRSRRRRSTSSGSRRSSSRFLLIRIRCSCPVPGISP